MNNRSLVVLFAALAVTGCGGGASVPPATPSPTTAPSGGNTTQEVAVTTANSLGDSVKDASSINNATSPLSAASFASRPLSSARRQTATAGGACSNGFEFFAPDKNAEPNSTEAEYFYDAACTELARDVVRLYTITGTSETVNRTVSLYAIGNSTAIAVRTDAVAIANGTYDQYGYPIAANGFDRTEVDQLQIANVKTIDSDNEVVVEPGSAGTNQYCSDSAGYSATGIAALGETFGWAGGTAAGTRTVNGDGSVTWSATHAGSSSKGAIGALAIAVGSTPNTACPISTPLYTLTGGSVYGSYSIPVTATYSNGVLTNLAITGATLANGNTLTVTTNTAVLPSNSSFITGTIGNASGTVATFAVDAFGDGTLTIAASGRQFAITDWHVIK